MRAASLLGVFVLVKVVILSGHEIPFSAWTPIAYLWQDLLVVLVFGTLDVAVRRAWIGWLFYAIVSLYATLNVPIAKVVSTPLTWPMLRATRVTIADSIAHHITWANMLPVILVLAVAAILPFLIQRLPRRLLAVAAVGVLPIVAFGPMASARVETLGLHRNALVALITTAFPRVSAENAVGDWNVIPSQSVPSDNLSEYRGAARGRNVILVVLESTAAQYLRPYGSAEDLMPNLTELAGRAVVFENAYAVYPESIKGLFAVLCSSYPAFDTNPEIYERVPCSPLASVLARVGYRTGLFHSGRFMYLGMDSMLRNRGYQTLEDAGQISGEHNSSFGVDEPSAVRRILSWIDAQPQGERFFVTYLPIAGHHPYEAPEKGPFPDHDEVGRYRNALYHGDVALGSLVHGLRDRGMEERTLWVILGDHGEAFGQHEGNYGHTFFLYDENVRVPYVVAAPGLLQEQIRVRRTVSLIDTAPTILDLLGLPLPPAYQGHSALEGRPRTALFFTDYSLGFLGLRDGSWKFMHELDSGRSKLFDLSADPDEKYDLADRFPERAALFRQSLLRWSAAQRDYVTRWH